MITEAGQVYKHFKIKVNDPLKAGLDAEFHVGEMEKRVREYSKSQGYRELTISREYIHNGILSVILLGVKKDVVMLPMYVV